MSQRTHLREALRAAHDELHAVNIEHHLDAENERLLRVLLKDIEHTLEHGREPAVALSSTSPQTLEQAALSFEERHPQVTAALQALAGSLRQAGL